MSEVCKNLTINGNEYVLKSTIHNPEIVTNYVICRTYSAGVHAGELVSKNGKEVKLKNARRLWYWAGAFTLSTLAMEGTTKPRECKFPCEVTEIELTEVIEIIPCTEKAMKSIKEVTIWKS